MKNIIFISLLFLSFTGALRTQINYKGLVIDNEGNPMIAATLISLKSMQYWECDLNGKYNFIAPENLLITVKYTGFKRFDSQLSAIDTIVVVPYDCDAGGIKVIPSPWQHMYYHPPSFTIPIESRKEFLKKKIKWIELESFFSRYRGKKYHAYPLNSDNKKIVYDSLSERISLNNRQKIVIHRIEKDELLEFFSSIELKTLDPGWYEVYILDDSINLNMINRVMAVGAIKINDD